MKPSGGWLVGHRVYHRRGGSRRLSGGPLRCPPPAESRALRAPFRWYGFRQAARDPETLGGRLGSPAGSQQESVTGSSLHKGKENLAASRRSRQSWIYSRNTFKNYYIT